MFLSFEKKIVKFISGLYIEELSSKISELPLEVEVRSKEHSYVLIIANQDPTFLSLSNVKEAVELALREYPSKKPITVAILEGRVNKRPYKKLIAVASGKGGVGKSTICANLAFAAKEMGYKVGIIDADIYGPSIHHIFGVDEHNPEVEDGKIIPPKKHGIQIMSMGFMVNANKALIWRGAMITKSLNNLISGTAWDDLDYLFVDMPPGTGDIYLSLAKNFEIDHAILVATPQRLSLLDVTRSIDLFQKLNVPILGLISNMSYFPEGDKKNYIFGDSLKQYAEQKDLVFLAELPLMPEISQIIDRQEMLDRKNSPIIHQKFCEIIKFFS